MVRVIIPSRTVSNLVPCIKSIRSCEDDVGIVVVDDGLGELPYETRRDHRPLIIIEGAKPFVYARNCNLGIQFALEDPLTEGVVLHNDDALLETPSGFIRLAEIAAEHKDIGIIAPVTNITGQKLQKPRAEGLRQVPHIAFVSVYIPRRTIEHVGLLDERYSIDYGVEDLDYCEAVNRAGLKVCVYDHVFVDHSRLRSTFRGDPKAARSFEKNYALFKEKWGMG